MSYRFVDSFRAGPGWNFRTRMELQDQDGTSGPGWNFRNRMEQVPSWIFSKTVYKPVWHIPLLSVQWINSWWWTNEPSETCRVSCQNKFVKLVHLVGFITKKFVTMQHGHMNVKLSKMVEGELFSTGRHHQHFTYEFARLSCITWGAKVIVRWVTNSHTVYHRYTQVISNKVHVARIRHCLDV